MSIVLGYDESPGARRALDLAVDLAARLEEPLVLVFGAAPPGTVGEEAGAHAQALAEIGGTAVGHAVEVADAAGVRTVVEVLPAKPVDALLDAADRHDARVIVVGTYGETPLRGAILGSVPHKLLHLSARPVLCVPAEQE
ncbi:Nucleotide-binding universal stress protein, UspA family [Klenkia marina]|uniref:Nucleotide-binding universal stress protein, UspA family n=1 Tax=Klenkia marina TaxID=1960309 RepID=A0A1G4XRP6_9ACTN|nr:universal stress protein [Klenkia marina]SCX43919.1 Nucleotide-binding universal stress protein, UspA family [Klenkia marina]